MIRRIQMSNITEFKTASQRKIDTIDKQLNEIAQEAKSRLAQEDLRRNNGATVPDNTDEFFSTIADMIELNEERKSLKGE